QPLRDAAHQPIPRGVPEPVVHQLEIVEIDENDPDLPTDDGAGRGRSELPVKEPAIWQVGEGIVRRLMLELALEGPPLLLLDAAPCERAEEDVRRDAREEDLGEIGDEGTVRDGTRREQMKYGDAGDEERTA